MWKVLFGRIGLRRTSLGRFSPHFQQKSRYSSSAGDIKEKADGLEYLKHYGIVSISVYIMLNTFSAAATIVTTHYVEQEKLEDWELAIRKRFNMVQERESTLVHKAAEGKSGFGKNQNISNAIRNKVLVFVNIPLALVISTAITPLMSRSSATHFVRNSRPGWVSMYNILSNKTAASPKTKPFPQSGSKISGRRGSARRIAPRRARRNSSLPKEGEN